MTSRTTCVEDSQLLLQTPAVELRFCNDALGEGRAHSLVCKQKIETSMPECVFFWQVLERKGKDLFRDICCLLIVTYNEANIFHTLITHNILYGFILSPFLVLFGLEGFFLHPI